MINHINIGIIGARSRNSVEDFDTLLYFLEEYISSLEEDGYTFSFVSGGCPKGGDHFAEIIAKELDVPIHIFYPNLKGGESKGEYAKACFARNILIAKNSDVLIALTDKNVPDKKGGTNHTVRTFHQIHGKNAIIL